MWALKHHDKLQFFQSAQDCWVHFSTSRLLCVQDAVSADPVQGANDLLACINEQLDQLGIHGAPSTSWPGSLGRSHSSSAAPISIHSSVAGGVKELDGDVTSPLVPQVGNRSQQSLQEIFILLWSAPSFQRWP